MRNWMERSLLIIGTATSAALASIPAAGPGANDSADTTVSKAERRAILDALRPEVVRAMKGPVEFVVEKLEVRDGWALVWAQPQRPGGGRIDPKAVLPAEQLEFTDSIRVDALLRYKDGMWKLEGHRIGATDVWYACHPGAPAALTGCETPARPANGS